MDPVLYKMIQGASIPDLVPVWREYPDDVVGDLPTAVHVALNAARIAPRIFAGASIAIAVGSRGISGLPEIVASTVSWLKAREARPFIVPAMGSHGGATAEGQTRALFELGVTEASAGCPIESSMEVKRVGALSDGMPVYIDAKAAQADGILVINRIKPHTAFCGPHESGLVKMIAIGLGKQVGADSCHQLGFGKMAEVMPRMAKIAMQNTPIIGGLGIVENAYDHTQRIEAANADELFACDNRLLAAARKNMPSLPTDLIHVLLLDEMGKNISGAGLDGSITGRFATPYISNDTRVNKLGVLDLTRESEGNATGMGNADMITQRLYDSIDYVHTYANALTTTLFKSVFTPMVIDTDENLIRCAIKTCNAGAEPLRFIRIKNTLAATYMLVSPALAAELREHPQCKVADVVLPLRFSSDGTLEERSVWNDFARYFR